MEEMLQLLAGMSPRAAVETNSVANYFLAVQLGRDLAEMRREIRQKITEKVRINHVFRFLSSSVFKYLHLKVKSIQMLNTEREHYIFLKCVQTGSLFI